MMKINSKNKKTNYRKNTGITLIALVVTIIVLLILAGISMQMLSGDNGLLTKTTEAKKNIETASAKEQIQMEVLGSYGTDEKLDINTLKTNLEKIGVTVSGENFPLTAILNGYTYEIDGDGNVTKKAPSITVDESSLTITNTDGSSITKGQVEQETALKITFNASVDGGTVTVNPSLPHTTTSDEISAKEVEFTITANVSGETVEPKTYRVSLKDVYKSNVVSMEELKTNANKYFGYDVINYANTLPIIDKGQATEKDYTQTQWQLFYAGALDIDATTAITLGLTEAERTEERIWLISKDYVKNTLLPQKNGATPILTSGSNYKAKFSTYQSNEANINDGILPEYTSGSSLITQPKLKSLNSDYYKQYSSINPDMRAVAYMLDTTTWSQFATSTQRFAEYAIGGPTVELLFKAYNKYTEGRANPTAYEAVATSATGYQVKSSASATPANYLSGAISNTSVPYTVYGNTNASGYWLASPSGYDKIRVMDVKNNGYVNATTYYGTDNGFRPIVLLNSNFQLEKRTIEGKEVFQIVSKTE